jgi:CheY-like chemotaxis protein
VDAAAALHVLERAQSLFSPVPSIVLAQSGELRQRARESGADEVVPNPPPLGELQTAVMRALGKPSSVKTR